MTVLRVCYKTGAAFDETYYFEKHIPMAGAIKSLLNIVVFVVVLIWVLQTFGLIGPINGIHIPNLK